MIPPLDPFAQSFDSIEIDPDRAPSQAAIESAMSLAAPPEALLTASAAAPELPQPGFYLLNDADGRFVVDRDTGIVTLADDTLLQRERNAIHAIRLRVVEPSGASYDLDMQLRITGRVPQMVGAEEFAAIAGLTDETILAAPRVPVLAVIADEPAQTAEPEAAVIPIAWTRFAVAQGHAARAPRNQQRRSFIAADLPVTNEPIMLDFAGVPAPFAAHLPWSL